METKASLQQVLAQSSVETKPTVSLLDDVTNEINRFERQRKISGLRRDDRNADIMSFADFIGKDRDMETISIKGLSDISKVLLSRDLKFLIFPFHAFFFQHFMDWSCPFFSLHVNSLKLDLSNPYLDNCLHWIQSCYFLYIPKYCLPVLPLKCLHF